MLYDRNIPQGEDSDTRKVIEEHLTNEDHEITDAHIRNVKVGEEDDEPTPLGAEIEARFDDELNSETGKDEDAGATGTTDIPDPIGTPNTKPGTKPPNPWEVLG